VAVREIARREALIEAPKPANADLASAFKGELTEAVGFE
jgi:hypothetical protein